jgi:putative addiction module component (TIGR02574 family)
MTAHAKSIVESALALSADERAELAERLILSLDQTYQSELTASWNAEIATRLADINQGRVTLIPGDDALRMIRQRIKP